MLGNIRADGAHARERILIEFVSPIQLGRCTLANARNAAYGDALGRLLAFHGHEVEREFYVNDAGSQVSKLGESILALAGVSRFPRTAIGARTWRSSSIWQRPSR